MCSSTFRLWCVKRLDTTGTESQRFSGAITDYVFVVVCRSIMDQKLFAIFQPSFVYLSVMTNKWVMFYCMLMHHLALANWLAAFVAYRDCVCVCVRACVRACGFFASRSQFVDYSFVQLTIFTCCVSVAPCGLFEHCVAGFLCQPYY